MAALPRRLKGILRAVEEAGPPGGSPRVFSYTSPHQANAEKLGYITCVEQYQGMCAFERTAAGVAFIASHRRKY